MRQYTGLVKWFSVVKGYGFIGRDDGEPDIFVHHTGIGVGGFKTLEPGLAVVFEVEESTKGPKAVNVMPALALDAPPGAALDAPPGAEMSAPPGAEMDAATDSSGPISGGLRSEPEPGTN